MIDSHCHLADQAFTADLDAVVGRARAAGVTAALCILAADDEREAAQAPVVQATWPAVQFAAGIHPHRAAAWTNRIDEARRVVERAVADHGAVAVGEIGLDYHYDFAARDVQRDVFAAQVDLAVRIDRPVVIHARESIEDTAAILAGGGSALRGVMHCFTGTVDDARRVLDLGFYVSLSGIVTFPRSQQIREVASFVPADRLLVETDAPYLAPIPHRGRRNEPAWVVDTLHAIAGVRGVPADDLAVQLAANTAALMPGLGVAYVR